MYHSFTDVKTMKTIISLLVSKFAHATRAAWGEQLGTVDERLIEVTQSTNEKFGHYQCNTAMKMSKQVGQNPRVVAQAIVDKLDRTAPDGGMLIVAVELAGPGFINVTLDTGYLARLINGIAADQRLGLEKPEKVQRIIVEFSSPNTAKEMHVGHLRSTIIGDSIARLFEFLGHDVLRLNHIGDWGTAFGMLIAYLKEEAPAVLQGAEQTDLPHLMAWYKASKTKFDEDPEFKKRSQLQVVALQGGDKEALKAWKIICDISNRAYQEIYDLLDIKLTARGESFYNPVLPGIVKELDTKGLITVSDGAKCIFMDGFVARDGEKLPMMVQKSDGGYNYDTTDMAAIKQRIVEEKADRIIYVTDAGQSLHFSMLFKAAELADWLNPAQVRVDHVPFGLVLGADGKKFKTRSGDTEKLVDLLTAAVEYAEKLMTERNPDMPAAERSSIAQALGIGAVKYADLSCNRIGDYTFSYDRMLKFDGNTAAFLMYSYVRVQSIKRKAEHEGGRGMSLATIQLTHPSEVALALHVLQYGETLNAITNDLLPNHLTDYLFALAEKFNAFFRDCRVVGSPEQDSRLQLCDITARTLQSGLQLLGIQTVERM